MSYTVVWTVSALGQLAGVWTASADRTAVTAASHRLDVALGRDPRSQGESRGADTDRTAFEPPLGVDFEIIEDDRKVRVLRVWSIRSPHP